VFVQLALQLRVQPVKAGAIFQASINIGVQGMISPTTPIGSCKTILKVFFIMLRNTSFVCTDNTCEITKSDQ
jgi:hypothetical protein